jgi:hypothetical protein
MDESWAPLGDRSRNGVLFRFKIDYCESDTHGRRAIICILVLATPYSYLAEYLHGLHSLSSQYLSKPHLE